MSHRVRHSLRSGFSLIEIGIVVVIIGILMAFFLPNIQRALGGAKDAAAKSALRNIQMKIEQYKTDTGTYPETLYDLMYQPSGEKASKRWKGPYIEKDAELEDGYGDELVYTRTPGQEHPYELYSWGGDEGNPEEQHINVWNL